LIKIQNAVFSTEQHESCLIRIIFGSVSALKDEKLIKANKHEKLKHVSSILETSEYFLPKFHQNWSLKFWGILFQSWCIFWDSVQQN